MRCPSVRRRRRKKERVWFWSSSLISSEKNQKKKKKKKKNNQRRSHHSRVFFSLSLSLSAGPGLKCLHTTDSPLDCSSSPADGLRGRQRCGKGVGQLQVRADQPLSLSLSLSLSVSRGAAESLVPGGESAPAGAESRRPRGGVRSAPTLFYLAQSFGWRHSWRI